MSCQCGKPTRDDAYVCEPCLDRLSRRLGEVPWLVAELDITLAKEHAAGPAGASSAETPLPLNYGAFDANIKLRHEMVMAVRFCDEEQIRHQSPSDGYPTDTLEAMSAWLLWRVDGLGLSDMGPEVIKGLLDALIAAKRVIDRPEERQYAGPCECGRDLYAKPGAKVTRCKACEKEYDVEEMRAWMRSGVAGMLVTAREGSTLLGRFDMPTAQKTIDKWHERSRILDHGSNPAGKRLYLIDDLIGLAARDGKMSA